MSGILQKAYAVVSKGLKQGMQHMNDSAQVLPYINSGHVLDAGIHVRHDTLEGTIGNPCNVSVRDSRHKQPFFRLHHANRSVIEPSITWTIMKASLPCGRLLLSEYFPFFPASLDGPMCIGHLSR